jgi:hypothetical protein
MAPPPIAGLLRERLGVRETPHAPGRLRLSVIRPPLSRSHDARGGSMKEPTPRWAAVSWARGGMTPPPGPFSLQVAAVPLRVPVKDLLLGPFIEALSRRGPITTGQFRLLSMASVERFRRGLAISRVAPSRIANSVVKSTLRQPPRLIVLPLPGLSFGAGEEHPGQTRSLIGGQSEQRRGEGRQRVGGGGFRLAGASVGASDPWSRRIVLIRQGVRLRRFLNGVQSISPGKQFHSSILPLKLRSERAGPLPEDRDTGRNPDCSGPSGTALSRACPRGRRARSRTQPWRQVHRPSSRPTTCVGVSVSARWALRLARAGPSDAWR